MKNHLRRLAAAALAVPLLVGTATVADAGTKSQYKSSGQFASVSWLEVGDLDAESGETEYLQGFLEVRGDKVKDVFGYIDVFSCGEGEFPGGGGGHGEEPIEGECEWVDSRFAYAEPGAVTLTMDKKLRSASITGRLTVVGGHDGEPVGTPMANITLTGVGSTSTYKYNETFTDSNGQRFSVRSTNTGREGIVSGNIGAMVFDDEPGEYSFSQFGSYKEMQRYATP